MTLLIDFSILDFLILSSDLCNDSPLRLGTPDTERLAEKHLVRSGRRNPSKGGRASPEKAASSHSLLRSSKAEKRDKRSSSLPDGRMLQDAATSASVERLTNSLVSSIIGEVTGKNVASAATAAAAARGATPKQTLSSGDSRPVRPPSRKEAMVSIVEDEVDGAPKPPSAQRTEAPTGGGGGPSSDPLTEAEVRGALVRSAALRSFAERTLVSLLDSHYCDMFLEMEETPPEDERSGVARRLRKVVLACWRTATALSVYAVPMAAPVSDGEVDKAMAILR